jgi:hypothetical protein|tara:strand:+ start:244 stop:867 length:624 start_codon:yes stop_codon:yes gene_type:complete
MAQTKIDICNQALLKVGADTIASLDTNQNTNESSIRSAKLCNILFDQALEETVRSYPWNSCKKRAIPVKLTNNPTFGYDNAFQLPNDCVRVVEIYDSSDGVRAMRQPYAVEGRTIVTDVDKIYLKYLAIPEDVGVLDSMAALVLIMRLAIKLATPLQLELTMSQALVKELEQVVMPAARSIDTFENSEYDTPESELLLSRFNQSPII